MPTPVEGGGEFTAAFAYDPATQAVQTYLSSPQWADSRIQVAPGWVSANSGVDQSLYTDGIDKLSAQYLTNAKATFRFDASDLMPSAVGSGAEWTQMTAWFGTGDHRRLWPRPSTPRGQPRSNAGEIVPLRRGRRGPEGVTSGPRLSPKTCITSSTTTTRHIDGSERVGITCASHGVDVFGFSRQTQPGHLGSRRLLRRAAPHLFPCRPCDRPVPTAVNGRDLRRPSDRAAAHRPGHSLVSDLLSEPARRAGVHAPYVGFKNYGFAFTDPATQSVLLNTLLWIIVAPLVATGSG